MIDRPKRTRSLLGACQLGGRPRRSRLVETFHTLVSATATASTTATNLPLIQRAGAAPPLFQSPSARILRQQRSSRRSSLEDATAEPSPPPNNHNDAAATTVPRRPQKPSCRSPDARMAQSERRRRTTNRPVSPLPDDDQPPPRSSQTHRVGRSRRSGSTTPVVTEDSSWSESDTDGTTLVDRGTTSPRSAHRASCQGAACRSLRRRRAQRHAWNERHECCGSSGTTTTLDMPLTRTRTTTAVFRPCDKDDSSVAWLEQREKPSSLAVTNNKASRRPTKKRSCRSDDASIRWTKPSKEDRLPKSRLPRRELDDLRQHCSVAVRDVPSKRNRTSTDFYRPCAETETTTTTPRLLVEESSLSSVRIHVRRLRKNKRDDSDASTHGSNRETKNVDHQSPRVLRTRPTKRMLHELHVQPQTHVASNKRRRTRVAACKLPADRPPPRRTRPTKRHLKELVQVQPHQTTLNNVPSNKRRRTTSAHCTAPTERSHPSSAAAATTTACLGRHAVPCQVLPRRTRTATAFYRPEDASKTRHPTNHTTTTLVDDDTIRRSTRANHHHTVTAVSTTRQKFPGTTAVKTRILRFRRVRNEEALLASRRSLRSHTSTVHATSKSSGSARTMVFERVPRQTTTPEPRCPRGRLRDSTPHPQHVRDQEATVASRPISSHWVLLNQYNEHVQQGRYEIVHFGRTLQSARTAIERKLSACQKITGDAPEDLEVLADIREYKRSLKAFAGYEAQEKLGLLQDEEEAMDAARRAPMRSKGGLDPLAEQMNELVAKPVLFATNLRFCARSSRCPNGTKCGVCGCVSEDLVSISKSAPPFHAPVPLIRPFDLDGEDDGEDVLKDDAAPPKHRRRLTRATDFGRMKKAMTTSLALSELLHSLCFCESRL